MKKILFLGINLAFICAVAAGALAGVYTLTKEKIEQQIWEQQVKAARQVLPEAEKFELSKRLKTETQKDFPIVDKVFLGFNKQGEVVGYAVQVLPRGYGGPITLMVGIFEGKVRGIEVVEMKETPGLGDVILNKEWQEQFMGKTADDPLEIKKDVDAISGATVSSKAVVTGVKAALEAMKKITEVGGESE